MIKLTLESESQRQVHCFEKGEVLIGSGTSAKVDLSLPHENLEDEHIIIMEKGGRFVIINHANDPFATLNGAPFAKRSINNGDLLQIGKVLIRFEGTLTVPYVKEGVVKNQEELQEVIERAFSVKQMTPASSRPPMQKEEELQVIAAEEIDIENELQRLAKLGNSEESIGNDDPELEELLRDLEAEIIATPLANPEIALVSSKTEAERQEILQVPVKSARASLKDFFEEESAINSDLKESLEPTIEEVGWNWKLIGTLVAALMLLALLLMLFFYFSMSSKHREEEVKVAEGIADISMALTYAQFNHFQPRNQNWTDPEFLKNNLISVLASEYSSITSWDMRGLFINSNYILRVYNSSDLSHYVIIAQPAPSLSQWVLPRAAIVVDSATMELRKIKDLKTLNRLLLNPNPLDGSSTSEVTLLIKQGELLRLSTLAARTLKQGFNPPKALALLRPGAENLIYNAPRYYRFGESFLKKAMTVAATGNRDDIASLQEEIISLSRYPDIILYSSQGMQWAVKAQKMLNTIKPDNKILLAYIKTNSSGYVASSHLLMDEGKPSVASLRDVLLEENKPAKFIAGAATERMATSSPSEVTNSTALVSEVLSSEAVSEVIQKDTLQIQLNELKESRQNNFKKVEDEWIALLLDQDREAAMALLNRMDQLLKKHRDQFQDQPEKMRKQLAAIQFLDKLQLLVARYDAIEREQRDNLVSTLTKLYQEQPNMSQDRFLNYVIEAGF